MKKAFLLFVCLILLGIQAFPQKVVETNYYSENAELGGEVVIKKSTKEVVGSKTIVTFEVEVPAAKAYHADFWMFPAKLKDGSLAEYWENRPNCRRLALCHTFRQWENTP